MACICGWLSISEGFGGGVPAPADAVRGAVKKLQDAGVRVLGSVLTRYDMKKALKGSSYAYSYAYNYNYAYEKQKADVVE